MAKIPARPPRTDKVTFPLDPNDGARLREAQAAVENARILSIFAGKEPEEVSHEDALEVLRQIPRMTFHLASCGPVAAEELLFSFPPTSEQVERHRRSREAEDEATRAAGGALQYDPNEFLPRLVAACCKRIEIDRADGSDPEIIDDPSGDDLRDMYADDRGWSTEDKRDLFRACERLVGESTAISREMLDRLGEG